MLFYYSLDVAISLRICCNFLMQTEESLHREWFLSSARDVEDGNSEAPEVGLVSVSTRIVIFTKEGSNLGRDEPVCAQVLK